MSKKKMHGMDNNGDILCSTIGDLDAHSNDGFVDCEKCIRAMSEFKEDYSEV